MKRLLYTFIGAGMFFLAMLFVAIVSKSDIANILFSSQNTIDANTLTGVYDPTKIEAIFNNEKTSVPPLLVESKSQYVLGATNVAKRLEVDLKNQRLYAFEGENKVYDFSISSGKWNKTPKGVFRIWIKLRYTLMKGGSQALGTYYYLPNVPYVMFFYNESYPKPVGYGIHGAYWHNNFGVPMSHGCINMRTEDAKDIYYWANPNLEDNRNISATEENPGTEIIIYGDPPMM